MCAVHVVLYMQRAADLRKCPGGVMRVKRVIIVPAILALSVAGSILASSSGHAAAAPSSHVVVATHHMN
jgi:hypothetical protein